MGMFGAQVMIKSQYVVELGWLIDREILPLLNSYFGLLFLE